MNIHEFEQNEIRKKINLAFSKLRSEATIKDCFYHNHDNCELPIKNAHSLQKQGSLILLEKEFNGQRFLHCHSKSQLNQKAGKLEFAEIGRKKASTFYGFCDFHDTHLFRDIENNPESTSIDSDRDCFLHSYRSYAQSYHSKFEVYKFRTPCMGVN